MFGGNHGMITALKVINLQKALNVLVVDESASMEVEINEDKIQLLRDKLGGLIAEQLRDSREALVAELLTV